MTAGVRAEIGQTERAIGILSCLLADPSRDKQFVFEQGTIGDAAMGVLGQLEQQLDPEISAAAKARGTALTLDVLVKELLAERR
jgi:hypothetical protein